MLAYELNNKISSIGEHPDGPELARFIVLYAQASTRKHKRWRGDGILICYENIVLLKSEDEKLIICRAMFKKHPNDLEDGEIIKISNLEVQIQERIQEVKSRASEESSFSMVESTNEEHDLLAKSSLLNKPINDLAEKRFDPHTMKSNTKRGFVNPLCNILIDDKTPPLIINEQDVREGNDPPTIVDAFIARNLRDHQKDGVRFIYSKLKNSPGGVILADEMGLGKTIQTIATVSAILKKRDKSVTRIQKCLLVVPSSLVNNWKYEFRKWSKQNSNPVLSVQRVSDIQSYMCSFTYNPYLLISYDMALRYCEQLLPVGFDIIVCDEGHRLKNLYGKLRMALDSLSIPRRLLLTGTPIQNDIDEFYSLLDFVRPGIFGSLSDFRTNYNEKSLVDMISDCMLRRTSDINLGHLPQKHEYVIFCAPAPMQKHLLRAICDHMTGEPLVLMNMIRKLANHPAILYKKLTEMKNKNYCADYNTLISVFPKNYGNLPASVADSGKLTVFLEMIASFRKLGECCVVVSNYVKTLEMLSALCFSIGLSVFRLDGLTAIGERQRLIDRFNAERNSKNIFLLSTKAGGVGLNLIGASRLIMFDSDWNPAVDLQAMARIWREGQTKPCHIYRLVTTGTIDEKILQRQIKKTGLVYTMNQSDQSVRNVTFRDEDLQDIFSMVDTECNTHDLLECKCRGSGVLQTEIDDEKAEGDVFSDNIALSNLNIAPCLDEGRDTDCGLNGPASMAELFRWRHFSPNLNKSWELFKNNAGLNNADTCEITFAMQYSTKF